MKNLITSLLLLINLSLYAQTTYVPDDNFEQYLIKQGYDDVMDDYVLTANINKITTLSLRQKSIIDITGINDFVALKDLNISNNLVYNIGYLSVADISGLVNLEKFDASGNDIVTIDLSNNTKLVDVNLVQNKLTALDVSKLPELKYLNASNNKITSIDFSANPKLHVLEFNNNLLTSTLDLSNQPDLYQLHASHNNIEDVIFNPSCKKNFDELDLTNNKLTSISLVDFENLFKLHLSFNELTSIQFGNNKRIYHFTVNNNKLTTLDFNVQRGSLNTPIFDCSHNQLTSLSISSSIGGINTLNCSYNSLSNFTVDGINVTDLDVSNNPGLNLRISNSGNIYNLKCNNNELTSLNITPFSLNSLWCNGNNLTELNNISDLYILDCGNNKITSLDIKTDSRIKELYCYNNNITSIDILPKNLKTLNCKNNKITTLNLDNIDSWYLTFLNCDSNRIQSLDLERFRELGNIHCAHNELTSLELTNQGYENPVYHLYCNDNKLTELDLRNIYIDKYAYPRPLDTRNNPDLSCIYVSQKDYYESRYNNKDAHTHYVVDEDECNAWSTWVNIPDSKFENELIKQKIDSIADGKVLKHNIMYITELKVQNLKIKDLTGIEEFDKLEELTFNRNYVSSIDLSKNTALKAINCSMNPVLASLDLSNNPLIGTLDCSLTAISNLDLTVNTNLRYLYCNDTDISELNLSNNNIIHEFKADNCSLTTLDFRNNNFSNMTVFSTTNNPELKCIYVNDANYCNTTFTDIDATTTFVADETACNALSLESFDTNLQLDIYPNPTKEYFVIDNNNEVEKVTIYNLQGKEVSIFYKQNTYNISSLKSDTYFIFIETKEGNGAIKLIKE
jgi:Leucine-rich repeat (LRR) protein